MCNHPAFSIEPWCLRSTDLDLDVLAQAESVFALAWSRDHRNDRDLHPADG